VLPDDVPGQVQLQVAQTAAEGKQCVHVAPDPVLPQDEGQGLQYGHAVPDERAQWSHAVAAHAAAPQIKAEVAEFRAPMRRGGQPGHHGPDLRTAVPTVVWASEVEASEADAVVVGVDRVGGGEEGGPRAADHVTAAEQAVRALAYGDQAWLAGYVLDHIPQVIGKGIHQPG
jgi:hypothetical protein